MASNAQNCSGCEVLLGKIGPYKVKWLIWVSRPKKYNFLNVVFLCSRRNICDFQADMLAVLRLHQKTEKFEGFQGYSVLGIYNYTN